MGLTIVVGALVDADDDRADTIRTDFTTIGALLTGAGAGTWDEPAEVEGDEFESWGYTGLHALRRLAVHLAESGALPEPLAEAKDATDDPLLKRAYAGLPTNPPGPFDHLIHHSDCGGYYVPVDFADVIADERIPGHYLGSSVRLLAEVRQVARAIGVPEDIDPDSEEFFEATNRDPPPAEGWERYGVEAYVCLQLLRAAALSVATGSAIAFC